MTCRILSAANCTELLHSHSEQISIDNLVSAHTTRASFSLAPSGASSLVLQANDDRHYFLCPAAQFAKPFPSNATAIIPVTLAL